MHDAAIVVFSGIACILVLLPLPIHLRARNYAVLINIIWLLAINLAVFINSVHFWDESNNDIPVFCDISVKVNTGIGTAVAACSLSINRRLAAIAASRHISMTQRQKRINLVIDIFICAIAPLIVMALSYIPQAQRFLVVEGIGCAVGLFRSLPAILLVYIWPVVFGAISSIYGLIAVRHFLARRLQFQTLLKNSQTGLNAGQFFRLMALANVELLVGMPLNLAVLIARSQKLEQWPGFTVVHTNWGYIREVSASAIDLYYFDTGIALSILTGWFGPVLAIFFFLFFGVVEDAIREYSRWWSELRNNFRSKTSDSAGKYVPKLGTAIARPAGYDWNVPTSAKDLDIENGQYHLPTLCSVSGEPARPGMEVSVQVDRQVF
uniref:STE3 protein n=3 Tax=Papiliotrema terrestris TaxID=425109 RepID=A0A0E4G269_9TREE|nr:STE3 protein [Papiliotrema terrestris]